VSFDPVLGPNLWVEVLTDRISESRAARLSPAMPSAPLPGDGGPGSGETGLSGDGVTVAVAHAEVMQHAGHIEEFGVVFQSVSPREDRAPGVAAQTVVEQRLRVDLGRERIAEQTDALASAEDAARALCPGKRSDSRRGDADTVW
jgi:hypothetical protein